MIELIERLAQKKIGFYCFETFPFDKYNFYQVNDY